MSLSTSLTTIRNIHFLTFIILDMIPTAGNVPPGPTLSGGKKTYKTRKSRKARKHGKTRKNRK